MKSLVYRTYHQISSFELESLKEAQQISTSLPFSTREEYLEWVKQWKQDYKAVCKAYRRSNYSYKHSICKNPAKVEYYKKKLDSVPVLTDAEKASVDGSRALAKSIYLTAKPTFRHYLVQLGVFDVAGSIADREYTYHWARIFDASDYWLIIFMLILRRASKIKAASEREKRIAAQLV